MGAVVSDNDGSAFITKAEFDSIKNDFQTQIDQYNTSIDRKIDGTIASYLAGIRTNNTESTPHLSRKYAPGVLMINENFIKNKLLYKYGRWDVNVQVENNRYNSSSGFHAKGQLATKSGNVGAASYNILKEIKTTSGGRLGVWLGYNDKVKCRMVSHMTIITRQASPSSQAYLGGCRWVGDGYYNDLNVQLWAGLIAASASSDTSAVRENPTYDYCLNSLFITYPDSGWKYENLCIYDDGNYGGEFHLYDDKSYLMNNASRTENRVSFLNSLQFTSIEYKDTQNSISALKNASISTTDQTLYGGPSLGFNPNITKWNQLISEDISLDNDNLKLTSGIPIVTINKKQSCEFDVAFDDTSYNYNIYVKVGEFSGTPSTSECETITATTNGTETTGKVVTVQNGLGTIKFENENQKTGTIFIKWNKIGKTTNDDDGMLLIDANSEVKIKTDY